MPPRRAAAAARIDAPRARLDVEERRRQLVALGHELFSTRTYDEVSIDELARVAGISKGLLYHYFPTKRDFYVATVREAAQQLLDRTFTPTQMDPADRLSSGIDAFLDYIDDHGPAYLSLLRSGIGSDVEVARIVDDTREAFLKRLLEEAPIAAPTPLMRVALRGWVGFVEAATIEWLSGRSPVGRSALHTLLVEAFLGAVQIATGVRDGDQ